MARFSVVLLNQSHRGLVDVWTSTLFGLRALGHDVELVFGPTFEVGRRAIVLGQMHHGVEYPADTILYCADFVGSPYFDAAQREVLRRHLVWDLLDDNVSRLEIGALHVPMGWVPQLETVPQGLERDLDVVLIGTQSPKRVEMVRACSQRGLKCVFAQNVWGADRDRLMARAKLILNVHYYENNFELPRLVHALANRRCVLSEVTAHPMAAEWRASRAVQLATLEQMPKVAEGLAKSSRSDDEAKGYEFLRSRPASRYLEEVLDRTASVM